MKTLIKKSQIKKEIISKNGIVWDYPMPSEDTGLSLQKLNGRIPDSERFRNKICNEIGFVISGKGTLFLGDQKLALSEGDAFVIHPGKKTYVIGDNLEIVVITSPNWYQEQCEKID